MTDKDQNESDAFGVGTGNYIQTYGANGSSVFIIGAEIHKPELLSSIMLTKHLPLEGPMQMDLRSRDNVKALYTACKRFLEKTETLK